MLPSRRLVGLGVLCTASFIAVADTTIVSIALPTMRQQLGFSAAGVQWVLNGYALSFGGLLLLAGRLGDLYGERRLFAVGLALFAVGSLVGGSATTPALLLAGRVLQGVGAAAFVPASLSLLTSLFTDEHERNRAIGAYGAMAAAGFVVGMVGGGVITELWGWRWVLFVNLPIAGAALVLGRLTLPATPPRRPAGLDVLGALTATGGLLALIYGVTQVPAVGWTAPRTVATIVLGTALLTAFTMVERRHPDPLVPPRLVTRRRVLVPNAAIALQSMVGVAWLYVLTLYFQEVLGHGPLRTGLLFAPMTVAALVAAPLGGRLLSRWGPRETAALGLSVVGVGIAGMMTGMHAGGSLSLLVAGMVIGESGFMVSNVALTAAAASSLPSGQSGLAAGLLNSSIQLGSGWGLGIVAVVVAATLGPAAADDLGGYADSLRWGLFTCLCFCAIALLLAVIGLGRRDAGQVT